MGRHKKLGDHVCYTITCPGFLKLGRTRIKKVRGRPSARYIAHQYFRHNDSIPEHYIDSDTRKIWHGGKDDEIDDQLNFIRGTLRHKFNKIFDTVKTYPLKEDERRRWLIACIKFRREVINPFSRIVVLLKLKRISVLTGRPLPENIQYMYNQLGKVSLKDITDYTLTMHPYYQQLQYMHKKYEHKRRQDRIKERTKNWKESYDRPPRILAD